jgi:RHS repeat-associated protein
MVQPPSEKELRRAGSMGGALSPTKSADVQTLRTQTTDPKKIQRLVNMNVSFGKAINERLQRNFSETTRLMTEHLKNYPDSPWAAEAKLHLAMDAQYNGRPADAQEYYKSILTTTSGSPKDPSYEMHQKAKQGWIDLDVMLGRWSSAIPKLKDVIATDTDWRRRTWASAWLREAVSSQSAIRLAQACGSRALSFVMADLGKTASSLRLASMAPPREEGFSMGELVTLASKQGVTMKGFQSTVQQLADVPLPFVAHYGAKTGDSGAAPNMTQRAEKTPFQMAGIGHYVVVRKIDWVAERVEIYDALLEKKYKLSLAQFAEEWSGYGLALSGAAAGPGNNGKAQPVRLATRLLSSVELARIFGGCCCNPKPSDPGGPPEDDPSNDPCANGPCGPGDGGVGSPRVSFNHLTLNMFITDTPLAYETPIGPDVNITLNFNSRDGLSRNTIFGNKWLLNYSSYLTVNPDKAVTVFMPNSSQIVYRLNTAEQYVGPAGTFNSLVKVNSARYELTSPAGDKLIYTVPAGSTQLYLTEVRDRWGYKLQMLYNSSVQLTTIRDAQNKDTKLIYDVNGRVAHVEDPFGRRASFSYNTDGHLNLAVDMEGNRFGYSYDVNVRLTEITSVQGNWTYQYEDWPGGSPKETVTVTDPLGGTESFVWKDHPTEQTIHTGRTVSARAVGGGGSSGGGRRYGSSTIKLGGRSLMTTVVLPDGSKRKYDFDPATSRMITLITGIAPDGSGGHTTRLAYNPLGLPKRITNARGYTTTYTYAANGLDLLNMVDAKGKKVVEYAYNSFHQPLSITLDPTNPDTNLRLKTEMTYKPWGAVATVKDANGDITTFTYDSPTPSTDDANPLLGTKRLTSISRTNGGTPVTLGSFTYDTKGRVRTSTDVYGLTKTYTYNDFDNVVSIGYSNSVVAGTPSTGAKADYACCGLTGAQEDRSGRKTYFDYDQMKRPIRVQDTSGNVQQLKYNDAGKLLELHDGKGNVTRYTYDVMKRLVRKTYHDGTYEQYSYDYEGNVSASRNARGVVTKYFYNATNSLVKIDYPNSADVSMQYDELGRVVGMTDGTGSHALGYDDLSRLTSVDGPWANDTVSYTYDKLNRRKTMQVNGTDTITSGYDGLGRFGSVAGPTGTFTYSYYGNGGLISNLTRPNDSRTDYGYDGYERLAQVHNKKSDNLTNISKYSYGFDNSTHREGVSYIENTIGASALQRVNYTYDGIDQLKTELSTETPVAQLNQGYSYDAMGNRTQTTSGGGAGVTGGYTYTNSVNPINQITQVAVTGGSTSSTALAYDAQGNLTSMMPSTGTEYQTYVYDDANRLVKILWRTKSNNANLRQSLFYYDGASRKQRAVEQNWVAGAWSTATDKRYVYDGTNVVQERDATNAIKVKYVRGLDAGGGIGGLLSRQEISGTTVNYFYHYDGNGNVTQLTDASQNTVAAYKYDAYGNTLSATGAVATQPYRYSTKEIHHASGMYDYGFRFYSPGLGRWINRDPIREQGGLNLYAFSGNTPLNAMDAHGLFIDAALDLGSIAYDIYQLIQDPCSTENWVALGMDLAGLAIPFATGLGPASRVANHADEMVDAVKMADGPFCFVAGTPIAMADGSSKPIEEVKAGDQVASRDEATGKTAVKEVKQTFERQANATVVLEFSDGERIETTKEHPFYVQGKGFVKAGELGIGTSIVTRAGPAVAVTKIEVKEQPATVYNFEVVDFHTYFVGSGQLWVHNQCSIPTGTYYPDLGHHIHAKAAFNGHPNYNQYRALTISNAEMAQRGWVHQGPYPSITSAQRQLFDQLAASGAPNTMKEHNRIAVEALIVGGASRAEARSLTAASLRNLRNQGVRQPTRIPWN